MAGPVRPSERVLLLDVLRGIALLGIFAVNMPLMSMPLMRGFGGPALAEDPVADQVAWFAMHWLFQLKFISLFSLLFGIGFAVQLERAVRRGAPVTGPYLRRLGVLLAIGLAHGLLVWFGDILTMYALLGAVLLFAGRLKARSLALLAGGLLLWSALLTSGLAALQTAANAQAAAVAESAASAESDDPEGPGSEGAAGVAAPLRGFGAMHEANFDPSSPIWIEAETRAYAEGPFGDAMRFRSITFAIAFAVGAFGYGWYVLALFCLGAALWKAGVMTDPRSPWRRRFLWLLPIGLVAEFAIAWAKVRAGWEPSLPISLLEGAHLVSSAATMLGYVGLVMLWLDRAPDSSAARLIAAPGRMALSCYLLESLVGTAIMYHWGLGWFGDVGRPAQFALVGAIWVGLVLFANLWFRAFAFGPAEWLWRTLTYLRPPRRDPATEA
ncbi:MAG TPA: DUF418 domain-containing protein [Phycisphaerales bacterium]|nr:DUF418 domain-containing protein [Phycisphaerales bacterium]HMP36909.1 DUF418 domain-containing protein [Phycisphaerales bacterium]